MNMRQDAELRVLRHYVNHLDGLIPEEMDEDDFNAACDRLEKMGYVKVAWVSGHNALDVRVNSMGRFYLKELEQEQKEEESELNRLRKENMELKALIAQMQAEVKSSYNKFEVIKELRFIFKGSDENAEMFLKRIDGLKPKEITTVVNKLVSEGLLDTTASSRSFYEILSKHGIYDKQYQTWNSQVKWLRKKA